MTGHDRARVHSRFLFFFFFFSVVTGHGLVTGHKARAVTQGRDRSRPQRRKRRDFRDAEKKNCCEAKGSAAPGILFLGLFITTVPNHPLNHFVTGASPHQL